MPMSPNVLQRNHRELGHLGVNVRGIKEDARWQQHGQRLCDRVGHVGETSSGRDATRQPKLKSRGGRRRSRMGTGSGRSCRHGLEAVQVGGSENKNQR